MRSVSLFAAIALLAAPAMADIGSKLRTLDKVETVPATKVSPQFEADTYRFGYPYRTLRGTSPKACDIKCSEDTKCAAWSLVPATFSKGPKCELKSSVGSTEFRPGGVSGIAHRFFPKQQSLKSAIKSAPPSVVNKLPPKYRPKPQAPRPQIILREPKLLGGPSSSEARPQRVTRVAPPSGSTNVTINSVGAPIRTPAPLQPVQPVKPAPRPAETVIRIDPKQQAPAAVPFARPVPKNQPAPRPVPVTAPAPAPRPAPAPQTRVPTGEPSQSGVAIYPPPPPIQPRKPWTERKPGEASYSVQSLDVLPGDEEATAGFVNGVPEDGEN